jgi:hypothetical protein
VQRLKATHLAGAATIIDPSLAAEQTIAATAVRAVSSGQFSFLITRLMYEGEQRICKEFPPDAAGGKAWGAVRREEFTVVWR